MVNLTIGSTIKINDECVGTITDENADSIYIESECFTGWTTRKEIIAAIIPDPTMPQSRSRHSQRRSFAASTISEP